MRTFKKQLTAAAHICSGCCRPVYALPSLSLSRLKIGERNSSFGRYASPHTNSQPATHRISPASSELQIGKDSFFAERKFVYRGGGWVGASCGERSCATRCVSNLLGCPAVATLAAVRTRPASGLGACHILVSCPSVMS